MGDGNGDGSRPAIAGRPRTARVVFQGRAGAFIDRYLRNGVRYRYAIVAFDQAGNRSRAVVVTAKPRAVLLGRPLPGQRVTAPPLLLWAPVGTASYFNVQLWRGKQKLLSAWPRRARYQVARTWRYDGRVHRLAPGRYTWYVWPGLGPRGAARYGPMLGKRNFIVLPAQ